MRAHMLIPALLLCASHAASAEPVAVIASMPSPGDSASGLGWDGEFLWVANLETATGGGVSRVSRLDPRTGVELSGFDMQSFNVYHGMAFDGEGNLVTDNFNKSIILDTDIVVLSPNGNELSVYPALGTIYGVALDNDNGRLFQVDNHSVEDGGGDMKNHLYELDPSDGSVVRGPIELSIKKARGVAWDGAALWVASNKTDSIYRVDVDTGAILDQFVAPGAGGVEGLAFDGSCLWISDTRDDIIYRVDHGQDDLPDCVPFADPLPDPDPDAPDGGNPDTPEEPDEGPTPGSEGEDSASGGCNASGETSSLAVVGLLLLLVIVRKRRILPGLALLLMASCSSQGADPIPTMEESPDASPACDTSGCAWMVETIDGDGFAAGTTSVALDSLGHPHVAYLDATNDDLRYAWFDGSTWTRETVDEGGVGWHASLALDSNDIPHIAHFDFSNGDLKYATKSSAGWQSQAIDTKGIVGRKPSIATDGDDYIHISYHDTGLDDLKYAFWDGSWHIETIDSVDQVGDHTSLALDDAGTPHISYFMFRNQAETEFGNLRYATRDNNEWRIERVDDFGVVGHYSSIAVTGSGIAHISYRDDINRTLKYAQRVESEWQSEVVDADGDLGDYNTSIALNAAGEPRISYHDVVSASLRYAQKQSEGWMITTIDDEPYSGHYSSLALGADDEPHFSFSVRDDVSFPGMATRIELKYARRTP